MSVLETKDMKQNAKPQGKNLHGTLHRNTLISGSLSLSLLFWGFERTTYIDNI